MSGFAGVRCLVAKRVWPGLLVVCSLLGLAHLPVTQAQSSVSLVPAGAVWQYLADGSNQGTAWRAVSFNDAAWASGAAQLGYGDGDEATVIGYGPDASNKYITSYFRRAFNVTNAAAVTQLNLSVKRDDGVVVYLNGTEIWRDNMPTGAVAYNTLATVAAADDGATWIPLTLNTGALPTAIIEGRNVLAVEIHQSAVTSSDVSFDLQLASSTASLAPAVTRGPYLQKGTPNSLTVRWRTNVATLGRVRYGTSQSNLNFIADETAATTEHSVRLGNLVANTTYFYSIGTDGATLAGGDANHLFVTAPLPGVAKNTRVWVLGDSGTANANQRAVRDAYNQFNGTRYTDLWLMLGDNAYSTGTDSEYQTAVFDIYQNTLRQSVLWSTLGNHDTAQAANPPADLPYYQIFDLPQNAEAGGIASGTEDYYSFDYGNIHFVCLDSMTSARTAGSPMLTWLQNDLAANTKSWLIAFWHHPPYTKGSHDSDTENELIEMRQNALPILESYGVDLVLTGHSHAYERSYLIDGHYGSSATLTKDMKKNAGDGRPTGNGSYAKTTLGPAAHEGAVYVVAGSSGQATGGALNHPAMFISLNNLGSLVLDVNGNRLDAKFIRETGLIADNFTLVKGNAPPTVKITSPASGTAFKVPTAITINADAADSDGTIAKVDFYQGTTLIGTDTSAPYQAVWNNVPVGKYVITAKATDNASGVTISTAVNIEVKVSTTTLVAAGSVWKYLANGSDQGTAWRAAAFNDTSWLSGAAQLGYGDGDEATVIGYGPDASNKYITSYFRRVFNANPADFSQMTLRVKRDDGVVVYLNGQEIFRNNLAAGAVNYRTLASLADDDGATFLETTIPLSAFAKGANVFAVEIHQNAVTSSDVSFDLALIGTFTVAAPPPPVRLRR